MKREERVFYFGTLFRGHTSSMVQQRSHVWFHKLVWHYRVVLSAVIIGQVFLLPHIIRKPWMFLALLGGIAVFQWVILRLMLLTDLGRCSHFNSAFAKDVLRWAGTGTLRGRLLLGVSWVAGFRRGGSRYVV